MYSIQKRRFETTVLLMLTIPLISSCLSTLFQKQPDYIPGTRMEVRETDRGEDYWILIGETDTTVFEAVLSGSGECYLSYSYQGTRWLEVESVTVDVNYALVPVHRWNPVREEDDEGLKKESDLMMVRRSLYRDIIRAETPMIGIEGAGGTVILGIGPQGKSRIEELVEYADTRWPDKD